MQLEKPYKACSVSGIVAVYVKQDSDYMKCKCKKCSHVRRKECLASGCRCCDLEDGYSLATKVNFDW